MSHYPFNDEITLAERAEELGKRAMKLGLIPTFVVRHFPDSWQFYIPNENESAPLTVSTNLRISRHKSVNMGRGKSTVYLPRNYPKR